MIEVDKEVLPPPAKDWRILNSTFYRRLTYPSMNWSKHVISNLIYDLFIVAQSHGGTIAVTGDVTKASFVENTSVANISAMSIYTASGVLLSRFAWPSVQCLSLSWNSNDQLVAVFVNGTIRIYDIRGSFEELALSKKSHLQYGLHSAKACGNSLALMTLNFGIIVIEDVSAPSVRIINYPDTNVSNEPNCWIPRRTLGSTSLEIVISTDSGLIIVDEFSSRICELMGVSEVILDIVHSPNSKFAAIYTQNSRVIVVKSDFSRKLSDFNTNNPNRPSQFAWCGNDSVIALWGTKLIIIGPSSHYASYNLIENVKLVTEVDGVRLIGTSVNQFVQKVPEGYEAVFAISSIKPGALLFDAYDLYTSGDPKCDQAIRDLLPNLTEAVTQCIDAACESIYPERQKTLLKVASFGRCFLDYYSKDKILTVAKILRILNALNEKSTGMLLTYQQYLDISPVTFIQRLIQREQFVLAFRLCDFLGLSKGPALTKWACMKIKSMVLNKEENVDSDAVFKILKDRLFKPTECLGLSKNELLIYRKHILPLMGISFLKIANVALENGFQPLAIKLINNDISFERQVEKLLDIGEDRLARRVACKSGNADLMYLVLENIKSKYGAAEFFNFVDEEPLLVQVLENRYKNDRPTIYNYYYQKDDKIGQGNCTLMDSYEESNFNDRQSLIKRVSRLYGTNKVNPSDYKLIDELHKLNQFKFNLSKTMPISYNSIALSENTGSTSGSVTPRLVSSTIPYSKLSVSETISALLDSKQDTKALKLKADCKVDDKRYFLLQLASLQRTATPDAIVDFLRKNVKMANLLKDAIPDEFINDPNILG